MAVDAIDRSIVAAVVQDGRATLQDLADRVKLSVSATRDRLRRLERDGPITGYAATVDQDRLGFPLDAFVHVEMAADTDPLAFEAGLARLPAVVEVVHATGDCDFIVRLRCADTGELHRLVRGLKTDLGATRTVTRVVLAQTVAARPRLPTPAPAIDFGSAQPTVYSDGRLPQ
jgi:Lrp/AsnC family transcriptional regulator, leucine-responsive regulatory protein